MAAADELPSEVVSDVSQPRMALKGRCDAEIAAIRRRMAPMSTNKIAITAATRPCSPRGVPIPIRHDEPEIEAASMNQETLQGIRMAAQMRTAHAARVVQVCEGALDSLAALAHQSASALSTNPAAIAVHRGLGLGSLRLVASPPIRLRNIGANVHGVEIDHRSRSRQPSRR